MAWLIGAAVVGFLWWVAIRDTDGIVPWEAPSPSERARMSLDVPASPAGTAGRVSSRSHALPASPRGGSSQGPAGPSVPAPDGRGSRPGSEPSP